MSLNRLVIFGCAGVPRPALWLCTIYDVQHAEHRDGGGMLQNARIVAKCGTVVEYKTSLQNARLKARSGAWHARAHRVVTSYMATSYPTFRIRGTGVAHVCRCRTGTQGCRHRPGWIGPQGLRSGPQGIRFPTGCRTWQGGDSRSRRTATGQGLTNSPQVVRLDVGCRERCLTGRTHKVPT